MQITICAFTDNQSNSVAYKKFESYGDGAEKLNIDKAVEFYKKMLEKEFVSVISTRKIKEPPNAK